EAIGHSLGDPQLPAHRSGNIATARPGCPQLANTLANDLFGRRRACRPADHEHELAAWRYTLIVRAELADRSSPDLLELLRHFARHDRVPPLPTTLLDLTERRNEPGRRFVHDGRMRQRRNLI